MFWRVGDEEAPADVHEALLQRTSSHIATTPAELPIHKHRLQLLYAIQTHSVTIVSGPTGSGKSTQLPQLLYAQGWRGIVVSEPRRLAAVSMAERVAFELSQLPVGTGSVGYAVRLDERLHPTRTQIKFTTDGCLYQETLQDPLLSRYSVVIVDEAHERSLHTDLLLALLKKILAMRPALRVIIASATLDVEAFKRYFATATLNEAGKRVFGPARPLHFQSEESDLHEPEPSTELPAPSTPEPVKTLSCPAAPLSRAEPAIVSVEGRVHSIECKFLVDSVPPFQSLSYFSNAQQLIESVAKVVEQIHRAEPAGDILVFLAGRHEIERVSELLAQVSHLLHVDDTEAALNLFKTKTKKQKQEQGPKQLGMDVLQLYAGISLADQMKVFEPARANFRKIILATNIAEASVTIDGIVYVVDTGRERVKWHDPLKRCEFLVTVPASKASALQRAGRAGRTRPGTVFRLYSKGFYEAMMPDHALPALCCANLQSVILGLLARAIHRPEDFDWPARPTSDALDAATRDLIVLGAVKPSANEGLLLTEPIGRWMSQMPLDPSVSRFLFEAAHLGIVREAAALAAMLSVASETGAGTVGVDAFFASVAGNTRALNLQRRLYAEEGDHLTLLNIFMSYISQPDRAQLSKFMQKYCLKTLALESAHRMFRRLMAHLRGLGMVTGTSRGRDDIKVVVRKALLAGWPRNLAVADEVAAAYRPIDPSLLPDNHTLSVHPSSVLFTRLPKLILFTLLIQTTKPFIQLVSVIDDESWVFEALPSLYNKGGAL